MATNKTIIVQDIPITVSIMERDDFICITDMAAAKSDHTRAADVIKNWLRNRSTLEFLGTWEQMYNSSFKVVEFDHFRQEAGLHTFVISVNDWIEKTNAIGLIVKRGRYGGTFAHKDIAFEFASSISPVFKLFLIKEFQRLKEKENDILKTEWNVKRFLTKNNYLIQTDAVKRYLIPKYNFTEDLRWLPYAEEADLLNVALFGFTARAWREANPDLAIGVSMDYKDKIKSLRESTGMNRKEFCEYFQIPYRTVTEWERDTRHAPDYVIRLLEYYIRMEGLSKRKWEEESKDDKSD